MTRSKLTRAVVGLCMAGVWPLAAAGPTFDTSGNGLLNGTYYFRETIYVVSDTAGDLGRALSVYGNISFDGNGNYSIVNGLVMDSSVGAPDGMSCYLAGQYCASSSTPVPGTYTIAASGYGYLNNPLSTGDSIYVLVANSGTTTGGLITGSTTEGGFNDLFIAAKIGSTVPSNGTFSGAWTMAGFLPGASPAGGANLFFPMNPDGAGNLGTVNASGYIGGYGTSVQTQSSSSVKYFFSNGAAVIQFPNSASALYFSGNEYLYFSPDNNFVFGGSPNGYDMIVGIRNDSAGTLENFSGLYYQSGIDQDLSVYATTGFANFDTYYGSLSTAAGNNIVGSQRLQDVFNPSALSSSFYDSYPASISGSAAVTDGYTQYAYGDGGTVRIGAGIWPYLGLTLAFQAPVLTGPGVFLNPAGVTNAASSAPFTAGISNGELLTLYGSNLAPAPAGLVVAPGIPFPTLLGGVQVTIDGLPAPIYYVSPGQVSVIVPYGIPSTYAVAQIQVTNNGVASNVVTEFLDNTSVGLFTKPAGGIGYGALLHNSDGSAVTTLKPAQPGEYVQAFVTGLGNVFPPIQDGAAGPSPTLSTSDYFCHTPPSQFACGLNQVNQITVYIGGVLSPDVYWAGLAPGLAGLYQIDVQIPSGLTAGDNTIDISGPDSYSSEALISVGSGLAPSVSSAASAEKAKAAGPRGRPASRSGTPVLRQTPAGFGRGIGSLSK